MAKIPEAAPIPLVDNMGAPDVFADDVAGVFLNNGNIHITFSSRRCNHAQEPGIFSNVVIGRLVIPMAAAENMVVFLGGFLERMKKQAQSPPLEAPKTIQ